MKRPAENYALKFDRTDAILEEDDFENAKSIEDIEETLSDKGVLKIIPGKNRKSKAYREARHSWRKLNRRDIGAQETEELPSYSAEFNGEKIHVHGYNHGYSWLPASDSVRKLLTETVERKLLDGKKVLMEENLPSHVKNDRSRREVKELEDIRWGLPRNLPEVSDSNLPEKLKREMGTSLKSRLRRMMPSAHNGQTSLSRRIIGGGKTLRIYSMAAMDRYSDHFSYDVANSLNKSRKYPEYALDHLNCVRANILPLRLSEGLTGENPRYDVERTQRSIYQAEQALREDGDVHLIVGSGHAPQIEDYIDRVKENGRRANIPPK